MLIFQDIYVLDTGIQSSHVAFNNRVIHGYDAISNPPLKSDPNGHGTQVAGKINIIGIIISIPISFPILNKEII